MAIFLSCQISPCCVLLSFHVREESLKVADLNSSWSWTFLIIHKRICTCAVPTGLQKHKTLLFHWTLHVRVRDEDLTGFNFSEIILVEHKEQRWSLEWSPGSSALLLELQGPSRLSDPSGWLLPVEREPGPAFGGDVVPEAATLL